MVANAKIGDRLRCLSDWYPARAGAITKVLHFKGPGNVVLIVKWENPAKNIMPHETSEVWPDDLKHFVAVQTSAH